MSTTGYWNCMLKTNPSCIENSKRQIASRCGHTNCMHNIINGVMCDALNTNCTILWLWPNHIVQAEKKFGHKIHEECSFPFKLIERVVFGRDRFEICHSQTRMTLFSMEDWFRIYRASASKKKLVMVIELKHLFDIFFLLAIVKTCHVFAQILKYRIVSITFFVFHKFLAFANIDSNLW